MQKCIFKMMYIFLHILISVFIYFYILNYHKCIVMPLFAPVIEEDFLRSQAALLEQVNNLQPLLDSPHIKGKRSFNIVVWAF